MSEPKRFDLGELYRAIDARRVDRGLSWSALSREVGVAASTIRRFNRADDAEADGVLTLIAWLGVAPEEFVFGRSALKEPLPPLDGGVVRADTKLIVELSTGGRSVRPGSRATIQRLVVIAQSHSRTVASLTCWSAV